MNHIIDNLWIGNVGDASLNHLEPNGGKFLIDVLWPEEYTFQPYNSEARLAVPTTRLNKETKVITTDVEHMHLVADIIHTLLPGCPTMVHCALGMERSPLTVVWYLMKYYDMPLGEAYDLVCEKHPQTFRHIGWLPERVRIEGGLQ